jgi:hypothetical protein
MLKQPVLVSLLSFCLSETVQAKVSSQQRCQTPGVSQSNGQWNLDLNSNGVFDGGTVDACLGSFGQQGDVPVVGKW